jgi:hypothetical protein
MRGKMDVLNKWSFYVLKPSLLKTIYAAKPIFETSCIPWRPLARHVYVTTILAFDMHNLNDQ